jgi:hypothetical protein
MNALTALMAEAKESAIADLERNADCGRDVLGRAEAGVKGESFPIRLKSGGTLVYVATAGPRGGITIRPKKTPGWPAK